MVPQRPLIAEPNQINDLFSFVANLSPRLIQFNIPHHHLAEIEGPWLNLHVVDDVHVLQRLFQQSVSYYCLSEQDSCLNLILQNYQYQNCNLIHNALPFLPYLNLNLGPDYLDHNPNPDHVLLPT